MKWTILEHLEFKDFLYQGIRQFGQSLYPWIWSLKVTILRGPNWNPVLVPAHHGQVAMKLFHTLNDIFAHLFILLIKNIFASCTRTLIEKKVYERLKNCNNSLKIFSTKLCGGTHYMQKRTISAFSKTLKIKLLPLSAPK